MNPKKRKPDPETEGEGSSSHPAAKRIPGITETPKASTSDSPSASQDPQPVDTETPSDSRSVSAIGALEPPRARPSHTPASTVEGIDAERQEEAFAEADIMENELDNASLDVITLSRTVDYRESIRGYRDPDLSCTTGSSDGPTSH